MTQVIHARPASGPMFSLPVLIFSTAVLGPVLKSFYDGFFHGPYQYKRCLKGEKKLRDELSEDQVDHMVEDSFPASDPPSSY